MTCLQLQAGARRRSRLCTTTLDSNSRTTIPSHGDSPLPITAASKTRGALRILILTLGVVRRAGHRIRESRRHVDKWIRTRHSRPRSDCPLCGVSGRCAPRPILRKFETAGVGGRSNQRTRAAGPRRTAGDVIGIIARTARAVLAADFGVVEGRTRIVAGGAVVGDTFVEDLEDFEGTLLRFCFKGCVEGREGGSSR